VDGTSNKFWEVWMDGTDVTTQWGKIGTGGQTKTKSFADEAKAKKEYDKLVAEKTGKGYVEKQRPA
jgi:DNA ligase-1